MVPTAYQQRQQELQKRIEQSIFLPEDLKAELLSLLPNAEESDFLRVEQLMTAAEQKQEEILKKIVEADETFVGQLKQFKKKELLQYQHVGEAKEREAENADQILADITSL